MKQKLFLAAGVTLLLAGCSAGPRMTVVTGTVIGLHASPGDGSTKPPAVTFAYKRSEVALIPTAAKPAVSGDTTSTNRTDTYSAFSVFDADIHWFGGSLIQQFIATGHAARIAVTNNQFSSQFAGQ